MHALRYLLAFIVPASVALGLALGGPWTFLAPAVLFGVLPLFEAFFRGTTENLDEDEERAVRSQRRYDLIIYAMVPIQYALLAFFVWRVARGDFEGVWLFGAILTMGMACGALGINVAHELGHRRRRYEQRMSKALLATSLYVHFFIEHNRGHHAKVATADDPASARYGETLYAFFPRTILGGLRDAWRLERDRLTKQGRSPWSLDNEFLRDQAAQLALLVAIAIVAGPLAAGAFFLAAGCGALLLETVNYIEHYGLARTVDNTGRAERVRPAHSWNANHPLGRTVLFELTRHSDHHANARRPYQTLRHHDEAPQFPTGYPGMMALAWFPPLWFAVMHPRIAAHRDGAAPTAPRDAVAA